MKFWKISPGRSGKYWEFFRDSGMMAIGWLSRIGDLDEYRTENTMRSKAKRLGYPSGGGRTGVTQMIEFYFTEVNDIVVAFGKKTILDIGLINGSYYYVDGDEYYFNDYELYHHRKSVNWLNINLSNISDNLLKALNRKPPDSIHEIIDKKAQKEIIGYLNSAGYFFDNGVLQVDVEKFEQDLIREEFKKKTLPLEELLKQAKSAPKKPIQNTTSGTQYVRNQAVKLYALLRANGVCDLCGENGPFLDKDGVPFLESHHIIWLSNGGEDSVENAVALCPNCHRKMHHVKSPSDIAYLKNKVA